VNVLFYRFNVVVIFGFGLELAQNVHCVKSPGCKPGALHLPVCLPCYDLSPLNFCGSDLCKFWNKNVEKGDRRCVRLSLLSSIELSKFNLLLNPPYSLQFHKSFRWFS
jgi:hypothetical protein